MAKVLNGNKTEEKTKKKIVYTPDDISHIDYNRDIGMPGEFPFTRGIHATMYTQKLWTMRQFSGYGTPAETNKRYKFLLERGQTGLSVAFDMPTLMGIDADHPKSLGEVGHCGVNVSHLKDMEILFEGIPLREISTSMTINSPAAMIWSMYILTAQKQGARMEELRGTLQNDILKEYIAQKEFIYPPEPSLKLVVDTIEFASQNLPKWNPISISGYHIREAGATAVQELAFTLADGFAYVEACLERGLDIDSFAPQLSFFFDCHNNFFEEIAKFRAARRIWARHMRDRYKAKKERSLWLRFHTQTAGCTLTSQQPDNNIVRVAYQALAAVLGGTQSLHTNSLDETLALPTERAVQIALRTQQILAYETKIPEVVDPLGGSYYVEALTTKIEEEAEAYFKRIEQEGGVVEAIKNGFFQREIAKSAYQYQKAVDAKEEIIVGVNEFVEPEEKPVEILKIDPKFEEEQRARVAEVKKNRDNRAVVQKLKELQLAAKNGKNLMPCLLDATREYATLGEMVDALKEVYGEYQEPVIF
jgi:methylmalonyl-CoA mutase N-terminal domain/subunit